MKALAEVKSTAPAVDRHAELARAKAAFLEAIDVRPTTRENYDKALTYLFGVAFRLTPLTSAARRRPALGTSSPRAATAPRWWRA
jgi:hypothetical protein